MYGSILQTVSIGGRFDATLPGGAPTNTARPGVMTYPAAAAGGLFRFTQPTPPTTADDNQRAPGVHRILSLHVNGGDSGHVDVYRVDGAGTQRLVLGVDAPASVPSGGWEFYIDGADALTLAADEGIGLVDSGGDVTKVRSAQLTSDANPLVLTR